MSAKSKSFSDHNILLAHTVCSPKVNHSKKVYSPSLNVQLHCEKYYMQSGKDHPQNTSWGCQVKWNHHQDRQDISLGTVTHTIFVTCISCHGWRKNVEKEIPFCFLNQESWKLRQKYFFGEVVEISKFMLNLRKGAKA